MKRMSKAQRAAGRETPATRNGGLVEGPGNPGVPVVRCAVLVGMPIADAIADANTLRMYVVAHVRPTARLSRLLTAAGRYGSDAVVEMLGAASCDPWGPHRAALAAEAAAYKALRAVPSLKG